MLKKIISILLILSMLMAMPLVAFADDENLSSDETTSAYELSLARLNASYDYLNEMYLTTSLGEYIEYSSQKDIDTLQRLADDITYGCFTDEEKCYAIWDWMDSNVKVSYGSYAPIDVFRTLTGVCSGHAQLMSALMKLSGIEAAVARGYLISTKTTSLADIYAGVDEGHQWVMAYYNNDWHVFDDLWGECGNNDREDIASKYYTVNIDGILPYTEEIDLTKGESNSSQTIYNNGEFYGWNNSAITKNSSANFQYGGCLHYYKSYYYNGFDAYYTSLSGAVNTQYGYAVAGGYYDFLGYNTHYIMENGIAYSSKVDDYNGSLIYMSEKSGIVIDDEIDNNGMTNGKINMYIGETFDFSDLYDEDTLFISLNKNIATTDGLTVTAQKSGTVTIRVCNGNSKGSLDINVYGDYRTSKPLFKEYCDHDCTHCVEDVCYCDYCGEIIEVEEVVEDIVEDEIGIEETPTEAITSAPAITPMQNIATPTDVIPGLNTTTPIINNPQIDDSFSGGIVSASTGSTTEDFTEVKDETAKFIDETVEDIIDSIVEPEEMPAPTQSIQPVEDTYIPIIEEQDYPEVLEEPSVEDTSVQDEEPIYTIYLTINCDNLSEIDIINLLNDDEFINDLLNYLQGIIQDGIYEYYIIVEIQ